MLQLSTFPLRSTRFGVYVKHFLAGKENPLGGIHGRGNWNVRSSRSSRLLVKRTKLAPHVMVSVGVCFSGKRQLAALR